MKKLDRYIFKQVVISFAFFSSIFTLIFWINRAIRLFDQLIANGHSSAIFLELAILSLPSIASIVFPLACFASVVFVTTKLKNDAEMTILQSSGLSPFRLLKPYFIFGVLCMISLGFFTTLIVPFTSKTLFERQLELDSSVSARLLKEGKFIHPIPGVTFFVKEIKEDGTLLNVFFYDRRSQDEFLTYTATQAFLAKDESKTALYMENGLIQTLDASRKELSTTEFKSVTIDLSDAIEKRNREIINLSHVPTWLLITNMQKVKKLTNSSQSSTNFELHARLYRPIFCFVAALLGFSSLLIGTHSRFGFSKQITLALSIIILMKIIESYTIKISLGNFTLWPLLYLPSLFGMIASILFLMVANSQYRPKFRDL